VTTAPAPVQRAEGGSSHNQTQTLLQTQNSPMKISIKLPPRLLSPNARCHWSAKAKAARSYRLAAWAAAQSATTGIPERWLKASVQIIAYYPTRRHPDPDNLIASLKAAFDGIADAGVVANDRGLWPERPVIEVDKNNPRIELTITEEN